MFVGACHFMFHGRRLCFLVKGFDSIINVFINR